MPNEDNKIIKYNHGEKSMKHPGVIYSDLESILKKMRLCKSNSKKSYTEKKYMHIPSSYLLFTQCSLDSTKNKLDCYRVKDCMKKFCKDVEEHAAKIINYEKKKMMLLTDKENRSYE